MAENSKIEWCDHTLNWWIGCTKVSAGCKNCYAENLMDKRYGKAEWGVNGTRTLTSQANRNQAIKWGRKAKAEGVRYRVFAQSLSDTFEDREELLPWRLDLFEVIKQTPNLDWLMLTKRPEVAKAFFKEYPRYCNLDNVWLGVSVENQEQANLRLPIFLQIPAKIHFVSAEPLLGEVDFTKVKTTAKQMFDANVDLFEHFNSLGQDADFEYGIDWVIVGGESGGSTSRPMHPNWVKHIRNQCEDAGVAFFFKQWGEWLPLGYQFTNKNIPDSFFHNLNTRNVKLERITYFDEDMISRDGSWYYGAIKTGKKIAGRLLGKREYNEFPKH